MPRRRSPLVFPQRVSRAIEAMIPGTVGGRVANAGSVGGESSTARATISGGVGTIGQGSGISFKHDTFTAAGGAEDLTLTYEPIEDSTHVYRIPTGTSEGSYQSEGTAYTRDGQTLSVLAGMGSAAGDIIDVRYAYLSGAPIAPPELQPPPPPWTVIHGIWDLSGDPIFVTSASDGYAIVARDESSPDGTPSITVSTTGGSSGAGVCFRISDDLNFWFYVIAGSSSFLYKVVAGTYTQVGTWPGAAAGDVLSVVLSGNSITAKRNGSTVGSTTDSFNNTATMHGVYSESTAARFTAFSYAP